jgi:hypothetical protein
MNTSEVIVPVIYEKDVYGLVKLDKEGKVLWQTHLDGMVKGTARFKDKIFVLLADHTKKGELINLHVVLVDPVTGKEGTRHNVYENTNELRVESFVSKTETGELNKLLIRTSDKKLTKMYWNVDDMLKNGHLQTIELNEDLSIKHIQTYNLPDKEALYIGSAVNRAGDLFVATSTNDQVVVYKFNASGTLESRIAAAYSARDGYSDCPVVMLDKTDDQRLLLALHFRNKNKDWINQIYKFDFLNKKVLSTGEEELNKAYVKGIELQRVQGSYTSRFRQNPGELFIVDMVQKDGKLAVVKEMRSSETSPGGAHLFSSEAIVVSFYDAQLKLIKNLGIDKKFQSFGNYCTSLGIHAMGDNLYLTSGTIVALATYGQYLCTINTSSMNIEKLALIDKVRSGRPVEGGATLWFSDAILLNINVLNGFLKIQDVNTALQKVEL